MDPEISGKLRNSLKYFGGAGLKCSSPPPTHPTAFFFFPLGPPVCINGIPDTLWAWGLKEEYCRRDCQPQQGGSLQDLMADTLWGGLLTPNEKGGVLPVSLKATRAVWTGSWANTTGHSDPSAVGADTALGATSQCLNQDTGGRRKWQPTPVSLPGKSHGGDWQTTVHGVAKSQT